MAYEFGLIGYPIEHSLSPWIHKQFMQKASVDGSYSMIEIDPKENFLEQMNQLKNQNLNGNNVTISYKKKIIPCLDEGSEEARKIGAVNTVLHQDGKGIGYNTDRAGYIRSLEGKFSNLAAEKDRRVLL